MPQGIPRPDGLSAEAPTEGEPHHTSLANAIYSLDDIVIRLNQLRMRIMGDKPEDPVRGQPDRTFQSLHDVLINGTNAIYVTRDECFNAIDTLSSLLFSD